MSMNVPKVPLDDTDRALLRLVQQDATLSTPQLAERVSLSVTPCWRRLKRLEADGFIAGYHAVLDRRKLGLNVLAFVQLRFIVATDASARHFEETMLARAEVLSCHKITGEADYVLQVVAGDLDTYSDFVEKVLRAVPGIGSIHSSLAMREIKSANRVPVPD